jgi:hypothetical protein
MALDDATLKALASIAMDAFVARVQASGSDSDQILKDNPDIQPRLVDKVRELHQQMGEIAQQLHGQGIHQIAATMAAFLHNVPPGLDTRNPRKVMEALVNDAGETLADEFINNPSAKN